MRRRGTPFAGLLYVGLAITAAGPRVIEFNARFGDPETQVVLALLETPLAGLLHAAATGTLAEHPPLRWRDGAAVTVVVASAGYPGTPRTGDVITGADAAGRHSTRAPPAGPPTARCSPPAAGCSALRPPAPTWPPRGTPRTRWCDGVDLAGSQHRTDIAAAAIDGRIDVPG